MDKLWKAEELVEKTNDFISTIETISNNIKDKDIYQISSRLKYCLSSVPENLVKGFNETKKIDKIRAYVKLNGAIEECKSYLELLENLRYLQTQEMQEQLNEINKEIMNSYNITIN